MATQERKSLPSRTYFCAKETIFRNSDKELGHGTTAQIVTEAQSLNSGYLCSHRHRSHFTEH